MKILKLFLVFVVVAGVVFSAYYFMGGAGSTGIVADSSESEKTQSELDANLGSLREETPKTPVDEKEKSVADTIKEYEKKLKSPDLKFDDPEKLQEEFEIFYKGLEKELQKELKKEYEKLKNLFSSSESKKTQSEPDANSGSLRKETPKNTVDKKKKDAEDTIKEYEKKLKSPDLKFDDPEKWQKEFKNFYKGLDKEVQKKFNKELENLKNLFSSYVKVCNILMEGSEAEVKALGPSHPDLKKLTPAQRYYVLLIYHGEYDKSDIKKKAKHTWIDSNKRYKRDSAGNPTTEASKIGATSNNAGLKMFIRRRLSQYNTFRDLDFFKINRPDERDRNIKQN